MRHSFFVRVTHWLMTFAFLALLVSGLELVVSHPRFYWGETGNVNTPTLFKIPIPSSRETVPSGYGYVLPDQNGWSRYLHFQSAWVLVLTGSLYVAAGFLGDTSGGACSPRSRTFHRSGSRPPSASICALRGRARRKPGHTTCCNGWRTSWLFSFCSR